MAQHYTPITSKTDVNALELNQRLEELSNSLDDFGDGGLTQTSPNISDFTTAQHDHEDAAGVGS